MGHCRLVGKKYIQIKTRSAENRFVESLSANFLPLRNIIVKVFLKYSI